MSKFSYIFVLLIAYCLSPAAYSQEKLTGLSVNPVLKNNKIKFERLKSSITYATLPFIDDFSGSSVYPNPALWTDNLVFINNEYPVNPPDEGVATFDALDANGQLYKDANSTQFPADTLTSVPIRLDSFFFKNKTQKTKPISLKDSVYLSFFYQPGGFITDSSLAGSSAPQPRDSLVLEFYSVNDTAWHWIWSTPGIPLDTFITNLPLVSTKIYKTDFKNVMIPIKDSVKYLRKGFRFRFRNYATVANTYLPTWVEGNVDIWNIDYVYIDTNRRFNDTTIRDIGFNGFKTNPPATLLKNYRSMPWKQYLDAPVAETSDSIKYILHNFNGATRNINQFFQVSEIPSKNIIFNPYPSGSNINFSRLSDTIFPLSLKSFQFHSASLNMNHDFKVSAFIGAENLDFYHNNDTASFIQTFNSYYAYDDGTSEAGYGLNGSAGYIAYRFDLDSLPDTLTSVAIFFNSTFQNANKENFNIMVWGADENNSLPGKVLLQSINYKYVPGDSGLDLFVVYPLTNMVILTSKTFFVGLQQFDNGGSDNLNIGFDLNTDNSSKIYYNTGSGWIGSMYPGSLMIRPVFGNYPAQAVSELKAPEYELLLYPNPVSGNILNMILTGSGSGHIPSVNGLWTAEIYSSIGKKIPLSEPSFTFSNSLLSIALPELSDGIYILRLYSQSQNISISKKFIVKESQ